MKIGYLGLSELKKFNSENFEDYDELQYLVASNMQEREHELQKLKKEGYKIVARYHYPDKFIAYFHKELAKNESLNNKELLSGLKLLVEELDTPRQLEIEEFMKLDPNSITLTNASSENIYFEDQDGNRFFIKYSGMFTVIKALQQYFK